MDMYRGYGYIENGRAIDIVDFRSPLYPSFVYQFEASSHVSTAFTFLGDTLYLADDYEIRAYDISEPSTPQHLGSYTHDHRFRNIEGHYGFVYALSEESSLEVFDYSDVSDPVLLTTINCGFSPKAAVFRDTLLFVSALEGISCFDISIPSNPDFLGTIGFSQGAKTMTIQDNYLYGANLGAGVKIIDISDPTDMILVQTIPVYRECRGVAILGDYLFATDWDAFVFTIDISDPENAFIVSEFELNGRHIAAHDIEIYGIYAFLCNTGEGVQVLDITDPLDLSIVANYDVPAAVYGIEKRNNFLYVGALTDGLRIVDISDVNNPQDVHNALSHRKAWNIAFYDSLVVVPAIDTTDVYFLDVSDPTNPAVVGIADHIFQDAAIIGDLLVGAGVPDDFEISDISNVEETVQLGSIEFAHTLYCVVCKDSYAYVSHTSIDGPDSVSVVDISNPEEPRLIYSIPIEGPYDLAIKDDLLLVAARGLHIFDISDPTYPVEIGSTELIYDLCRGIAVSGDFVYVCYWGHSEVKVFQISDPTDPIEVASYYTGYLNPAEDVTAWDNFFAISCSNAGIDIVRNMLWYETVNEKPELIFPQDMILFPPSPNPFNSSTILRFQLPAIQYITLDLFDLQGRLLKTVATGAYSAGDHSLSFDGSDLASGMYFVRLVGSQGAATRKITLVK